MDRLDLRLLKLLQDDAGRSTKTLADTVGLSVSACAKRIARLKREGFIHRITARLDRARFPAPVTAAVMVTLSAPKANVARAFTERMNAIDAVQQCHAVTGDFDFLLVLRERSIESYHDLAEQIFGDNPDVQLYKTSFILRTTKSDDRVPDFCLEAALDTPPRSA